MNRNKRVDDPSPGSIHAGGDTAFGYLFSFEFIFILCMMREILEIIEDLNQALQRKTQAVVNAIRLVFSTKVCIQKLRYDNRWEEFYIRLVEFCVGHCIDVPNMQAGVSLCPCGLSNCTGPQNL
jgi:hypothetical protein